MSTKTTLTVSVIAIALVGAFVRTCQAAEPVIERMPARLETQFALSALPPVMRDKATVYLLDPKDDYQLYRLWVPRT